MRIPFVISVAILLGLLLLLFKELRRSPGPRKWGRTPVWKKRIRVTLAVILLLLFSAVFWALFIETNRLVLHQQTVQLENCPPELDRKSTRLNSSHGYISYAVFCLK